MHVKVSMLEFSMSHPPDRHYRDGGAGAAGAVAPTVDCIAFHDSCGIKSIKCPINLPFSNFHPKNATPIPDRVKTLISQIIERRDILQNSPSTRQTVVIIIFRRRNSSDTECFRFRYRLWCSSYTRNFNL